MSTDEASAVSVTVVIPTHRRPEFLRSALESVVAQTVRPAEVIVVSDCPDSDAAAIVAGVSAAVSARFVEGHAGGASSSRNTGAALATTSLVAFLDDDDVWASEYLRRMVDKLQSASADVVVSWFDVFTETGGFVGERAPLHLRATDVVAKNWGTTGSNLLVSRRRHEEIGGFDSSLATKNDTDYFYRLLKSGAPYTVVPEVLMFQRKHGLGQLTDKSERRAAGNERYLEKHHADLRMRDRRDLRLAIHRIRRSTARHPGARVVHTILAFANYSPRKYLEEREIRRRGREPSVLRVEAKLGVSENQSNAREAP